jgi:hypothetical protein
VTPLPVREPRCGRLWKVASSLQNIEFSSLISLQKELGVTEATGVIISDVGHPLEDGLEEIDLKMHGDESVGPDLFIYVNYHLTTIL